MKQHTPVTRIMSRNVVTVHHGDPVSKVRKTMTEHNIHHIPVVSGDQLIGILSLSDILRVSFGDAFNTDERAVDATLDHTMTLEDLMEKQPVTLSEQASVRDAAAALASGKFHAVPVVNGRKLVGIVTSTDLIQYLLEQY